MLRSCVVAWLLVAGPAHADPEVTAYVAFGLGPEVELGGPAGERLARPDHATYLTSRLALGGTLGRFGVELFGGGSRLDDVGAEDSRDRARSLRFGGIAARYAIVHHRTFVFAGRAGLQLGSLSGDEAIVSQPVCDPGAPCPPAVTYTPPSYGLLGASFGVRAQVQGRPHGGLIAAFVDLELSPVSVGFPDDRRFGTLRAIVFGLSFGSAN